MKNEQLSPDNITIGKKVKIKLPRRWCQVGGCSPYLWCKATVIEINKKEDKVGSCVLSVKAKIRSGYIDICDRMWCPIDKETNKFYGIYICK